MNIVENELAKLDNIMIKYISALKVLETQLEIINDDFKYIKKYNPIEHIKSRIKSADSIIKKLEKNNLDFSLEAIEENINDIVGIRIICSFESDVFELINIIRNSNIIHVIKEKDYITNPKPSGYRSYHMIVEVPVELINDKVMVKAEIQIRTMAMDLWASLDHKLNYKNDYTTNVISSRLRKVSDSLNKVDNEMMELLSIENDVKLLNEGDSSIE